MIRYAQHITASVLVFLCLSFAQTAMAQSVKLTGVKIDALLRGNTVIGKWEGVRYRQYFAPDGITLYAQEGSKTTRGEWRVDLETAQYQSRWPRDADWQGWFVASYADAYYWLSKTTPPTPFHIESGKALAWPTD